MYSRCIFCSGQLGSNETLEHFPVGRSVAFDAWKGRLWAVCRGCGRWNLAPIEERWEAVEAAEKLFRDSRVRVQSENIGITRGPDGTRLIRVGEALQGEIAALRYGGELVRRRRAHYWGIGAVVAGAGVTAAAGLPLLFAAGVPATLFTSSAQWVAFMAERRARRKIVQTIGAAESPTGSPLVVRREHLYDAVLRRGEDAGELVLRLPPTVVQSADKDARYWEDDDMLTLSGRAAQRTVARAITDYNARGASRDDVAEALKRLTAAGAAESYMASVMTGAVTLARPDQSRTTRRRRTTTQIYTPRQILGTFRGEILPVNKMPALRYTDGRKRLEPIDALALEMALHEESERAALEGELAALEEAWREAEEIAAIADSLSHDMADRFRQLRR